MRENYEKFLLDLVKKISKIKMVNTNTFVKLAMHMLETELSIAEHVIDAQSYLIIIVDGLTIVLVLKITKIFLVLFYLFSL